MKKHLSAFVILIVALLATATPSCTNQFNPSVLATENANMEEIMEMVAEATEDGKDITISYDSLNNRTILKTSNLGHSRSTLWSSISQQILPLSAVVLSLTMPGIVTILIFFFFFRYLRKRRLDRYQVVQYAIDHGVQLPDSFYLSEAPKNTNTPRSAIVWIGWGLAIIILFLCTDNEPLAALGLIPLFVGIARGVTYLINRHDAMEKKREEREQQAPLFPDFKDNDEE